MVLENSELIIKTFQGLEDVLAQECRQLGFRDIEILNRAVKINGSLKDLYRANYFLRTAIKVLVPVFSFSARNDEELYDGIKKYDWLDVLDPSMTLAIECVLHSEFFTHSKFIAQKTKDAIVDQIRDRTKRRPRVDLENPDFRISLHITEDKIKVFLDSSGDPLFKRGYRIGLHQAPLNEVLAAGLLLIAGWKGKGNLVDPMCGSGTLLIEGAMIAHGLPPGMYREKFGFEVWNGFDQDLYSDVTEEDYHHDKFVAKIVGGDISQKNIRIARENLHRSSLFKKVELVNEAMETFVPPSGGGWMVTNPPYGDRLKMPEINNLYGSLGSRLKHFYKNYQAWVLSGNMSALKNVGLRPSFKKNLVNGSIPCLYSKYDLYEGSLKQSKRQ
ncbi:MAG: RNA methyltransferase [Bacteroidetes bacterium]|nr:RNA methyltransferase [Bacteroidota bacterium]MBT7465104.1 RNA methyltransferase [Bacteroidota bacterium]